MKATGRVIVAGVWIGVAVALASASAAQTVSVEKNSISFVRGPSIYLVSFDGHHLSLVVRGHDSANTSDDYSGPEWSSDGRRFAYTVYVLPAEGSEYSEVGVISQPKAPNPGPYGSGGFNSQPSWAPDGRHLVFVSWDGGNNAGGELYIWHWASGAKASTPLTPYGALDGSPAWSPDGSEIAFARGPDNRLRLHLIRPDGSRPRQLTTSSAENPSWSPDSRRLAFDDGHRIAVIDADGKNLKYLTRPKTRDLNPAWSPDGRWIAFERYRSKRSQTADLWLMDAHGGSLRLLARNASEPAWKPTRGLLPKTTS